jgi:hypothetical protein
VIGLPFILPAKAERENSPHHSDHPLFPPKKGRVRRKRPWPSAEVVCSWDHQLMQIGVLRQEYCQARDIGVAELARDLAHDVMKIIASPAVAKVVEFRRLVIGRSCGDAVRRGSQALRLSACSTVYF